MPFREGEVPCLARPLQSPVFCSTSSCQTINTPLSPLTPISPTAAHSLGQPSPQDGTIPFNASTPRLVQRLFIFGPTASLAPVLSEENCPAELVYKTLVQNPPYYYEYTPSTHPISTSLPSGLPFPTSHPLRPSATRPQSEASVVRTLLGLAQTQPLPPAALGVLARNFTLLRFSTACKTLTALHSAS